MWGPTLKGSTCSSPHPLHLPSWKVAAGSKQLCKG